MVRTLRNAIEQGRVHHAYLFVGSRGTGKTSMAKILAASLNCVNGPTVTPCGVCESCVAIASATSLDVIEMDAASNNSVDDIRDLRERVGFAPVSGSHKVYILDEAHMLSTAAWNAFLKTLEEPPPHTIFVLATTEANKVLPTVVDRCHRFDFARPSVPQITDVVRRVAAAEEIEIPDEAAALVARSATGSFRDALGTLEQLVAYSGRSIALDDVLAVLGAADADLVFGAVDAVAAGNAREALLASARLADSGRDLGRFFSDLEAHARALMVVQALGEVPAELRVTPGAGRAARRPGHGRRAGRRGPPAGHDRRRPARPEGRRRRPHAARAGAGEGGRARPRPDRQGAAGADRAARGARRRGPARGARREGAVGARHRRRPHARRGHRPGRGPAARGGHDDAAGRAPGRPPAPTRPPRTWWRPCRRSSTRNVTAVAVVEPDAPTPAEPSLELSLDAFADMWPGVIESLEGENGLLAALLREATPLELTEQGLTLAWPESAAFLKRQAEDPAKRELLAESIRAVTGASLRLAFELRADEEVRTDGRGDRRGRAGRPLQTRVRRGGGAAAHGGDLMPQPPNLQNMLRQAQEMMAAQQQAQETLKSERVEASAGGGMVKVVMTGDMHLESIAIDPDAVDPEDVEMLQDMVVAAVNEALRSAQELAESKLGGMGGGDFDPMSALDALGLGGMGGMAAVRPAASPIARPAARRSSCSRPRYSASSPSWRSCPASVSGPRSAWPSTSCAPRARTRLRWRPRSATSRRRSRCARSASTSPRGRAARSASTSGATPS